MPIDTSIYGQIQAPKFESPLNALANVLPAIEGLQKNKLMQQQMADTEAMNNLYRGAVGADGQVDRAALFSGAASGGLGSKIPGMMKQFADVDKETAAANKTRLEASNLALTQHRAMLNNVNDPETAKQWLVAAYQNQYTKPIFEGFGPLEEAIRRFDAGVKDPASFAKWKQGASLNADELVKYTTPDANTVANNQTSRANNAATNATTMRGQNMTDQRQRDMNDIAKTGKVAETSTSLRKEFEGLPEVKNYKQALPSYKGIEDAVKRNTPMSDINIVYGIAKLYDPNSVVREGEYATVANSPAIPERIKGYAQYIAGGGKLTSEVKNQILTEAKSRIKSYEDQYAGARTNYEDIAKRSAADPSLLFPSPMTPAVAQATPGGVPPDIAALLKKHGGK